MFIKEDSFIVKNLEEYMDRQKEFDLAISLEVAEHLSQESAENFVKTLISCADYIIFSAAIPQQR
jgi:2-polyprenyl-3-methyl-5-hydroxy-6-metoxy-1,4-benzoquinol methylase